MTYSSPVPPSGTGRSAASSTYRRTSATGVPSAGTTRPDSGALTVAHTVVSVGPYALTRRRPADQRATTSGGQASPATASAVICGRVVSGGRAARTDGGRVAWVTRCSATSPARPAPGSRRAAGAMTRVAPVSQAPQISATDASKLGDANCRTRLPAVTVNRSACAAASPARPACGTTTPLGTPVEPEVWMTYAAWPGVRRTPGPVAGWPDRSRGRVPSSRTRTGATSARMNARRARGYSGSTGTYAPPAFRTASRATASSTERGRTSATRVSGPTPCPASQCARRLARASSSRYVRVVSSKASAVASGVRATCRAKSSGKGPAESAETAACVMSFTGPPLVGRRLERAVQKMRMR